MKVSGKIEKWSTLRKPSFNAVKIDGKFCPYTKKWIYWQASDLEDLKIYYDWRKDIIYTKEKVEKEFRRHNRYYHRGLCPRPLRLEEVHIAFKVIRAGSLVARNYKVYGIFFEKIWYNDDELQNHAMGFEYLWRSKKDKTAYKDFLKLCKKKTIVKHLGLAKIYFCEKKNRWYLI